MEKVPMLVGGPFRKTVFWIHLAAGVTAGLVVLMMSVTGVLLTYERQIVAWVDESQPVSCSENCGEADVDRLYDAAVRATGSPSPTLTVFRDASRPVTARAGRGTEYLIDPYDGSVIREGTSSTDQFFAQVMRIHRWFALEGDSRDVGRAITGYSNLFFLGLLITGIYLWLPQVWTSTVLKARVLINLKPRSAKARDFNWHHAFSFWSFIPLVFIITTATVFYFDWSNRLVYGAFGESPPERRQANTESIPLPTDALPVSTLLSSALSSIESYDAGDWQSLAITVPEDGKAAAVRIDRSIGGQPAKVVSLEIDRASGDIASAQRFSDRTPGQQARFIVRFLHTGEVLGVAGQTIAGLASLAACFLVWSGLALAWRRLVQPVIRRRQTVSGQTAEDAA